MVEPLTMHPTVSFETTVPTNHITQCHALQDTHHWTHYSEKLTLVTMKS